MSWTICWDIDLTLLTTARAGIFALEDAVREVCGVEPRIAALRTAGLTDAEIAVIAIESADLEPTPERVHAFLRCYEQHLPERLYLRRGHVMPGAQEILQDLAPRNDVLQLLLTGNTRVGAAAKLAHYGLEGFFEGGGFCEGIGARSEIAERARRLAERRWGSEFSEERFVVIGDSPHDIACGHAVGARTVGVSTGVHSVQDLNAAGAWQVFDRLPPRRPFLEKIGIGVEPEPRLSRRIKNDSTRASS
jgi:phosphoglycolate phosphatase